MHSCAAARTAAAMSASDSGDSATVLFGNKSVFPRNADVKRACQGRCIQDSVGRSKASLTLRFKWLRGYDYLASDKPPQQCDQPQKSRDDPWGLSRVAQIGPCLAPHFFYPGLPNPFVEFGALAGLQPYSL